MIGKTHRVGGIAFGSLASTAFVAIGGALPVIGAISITSGSAIGSVLLDIDHKGSMIGKKFPHLASLIEDKLDHRGVVHSLLGLFIFSLMTTIASCLVINFAEDLKVLIFALAGLVAVASANFAVTRFFRLFHRRLVKKAKYQMDAIILVVCAVLTIVNVELLCNLFVYYVIGLVIGYFSHLVLDTFNPTGIKWLYPIKTRVSLANIRTGSHAEGYVFKICVAVAVISSVAFFFV